MRILVVEDEHKVARPLKEDLKVGERVAVFSQENADGSVTAQNIQLNPILRGGASPTPMP